MESYFEQAVVNTRRVVEHVNETYAKPIATYTARSFETRPVITTFTVIYVALSIVPILSFISFSLFAIGTLFFIALCGAILASLAAILIAFAFLAGTLFVLLLLACFLTVCTLAAFLLVRLALLARGLSTQEPRSQPHNAARKHGSDAPLDASESTVDVKEPDGAPEKATE